MSLMLEMKLLMIMASFLFQPPNSTIALGSSLLLGRLFKTRFKFLENQLRARPGPNVKKLYTSECS